jgi:ribokinase
MTILVVGDLVTDVLVSGAGPLATGSDTAADIRIGGGGQAANTAAWLARVGADVTLIASVGTDAAGNERLSELRKLGVRCSVRRRDDAPTGSVVVLSSPAERTMISDRGASALLDPEDVTAAITAAPHARHLHLSGYPLLHARSRPGGLAALTAARSLGITTSVDAASAAPLRAAGDFLELVRGTDLLLVNADEAAALTGSDDVAPLLAYARNVVLKRGPRGALWQAATGETWQANAVSVPAVDPTGAGDAFAAGLVRSWLDGDGPREALAAGARLGGAAVQVLGARPGGPARRW